MALKIPGTMYIKIQCKDNRGQTGTFLVDEYGDQFGDTYRDCVSLFNSFDYAFCKRHDIPVFDFNKNVKFRMK